MELCPSCGGVIGRDCFNTQDCAMISQSLENDSTGDDKVVTALQEAKESIEFAMSKLDCPEHLVETWGNMYMHIMDLIDDALISKRALKVVPPTCSDDLPF